MLGNITQRAIRQSAYRLATEAARPKLSVQEYRRRTCPAAFKKEVVKKDDIDITPAQVLDTLGSMWFSKYAILPDHAETFLTLWAAHTHYRDSEGVLAFKVTPRTWLLSREPGSAKSLVASLLGMLSYKVSSIEIEPTAPGLKMILGRELGTAILDEGDILFGTGKRKEDVRAILNAGYSRVGLSGTVTNAIGGKPNRISVFGPVALAGLDVIETGTDDMLQALLSRGVKIRMVKATPARVRNLPSLEDDLVTGTAERDAEAGRNALEWLAGRTWNQVISDPEIVVQARVLLPPSLDSRAAQIWNPLARIALAVGDEWPERTASAALALSGGRGSGAIPAAFSLAFGV